MITSNIFESRFQIKGLLILVSFITLNSGCYIKYTPGKNINDLSQNSESRISLKLKPGGHKLRSGKTIIIYSNNITVFKNGDRGLVLTYETKIPIKQKVTLRSEVNEIWEEMRMDTEKVGLNFAAIRSYNKKLGIGYGFVFIRQNDSSWYCVDDEKRQ